MQRDRESNCKITSMSHKSGRIAMMIESFQGKELDAHYLGFFDCFNRQLFYEAHDVLEDLWLPDRQGENGNFYKGLIQLAGAFVHLQKNRLRPSAALFKLAQTNLEKYPGVHEQLDLVAVLALITEWLQRLEEGDFALNPLTAYTAPELKPQPDSALMPKCVILRDETHETTNPHRPETTSLPDDTPPPSGPHSPS